LPKAGILTIKMRDGSVHTVNLSEVQEARIDGVFADREVSPAANTHFAASSGSK
jgi:hypothetical protein